jgi:hypothetical protein
MTAIVKRPVQGPVLVHLAYRKPPANREWLLSSGFRLDGYDGGGWWRVQRARTDDLLRAIIDEFGAVELWVEARRTTARCDIRCVEAKGWDCECSCGGLNHRGTTHGWVQAGTTGLVRTDGTEWTRRTLTRPQMQCAGHAARSAV